MAPCRRRRAKTGPGQGWTAPCRQHRAKYRPVPGQGSATGAAPRGSSPAEDTFAEGTVTGEAGNADSAPTAAAAAAAADTTPPVKLLVDSEGKLFACGDRVRLRGLRKETALNGKAGAVSSLREDLGRVCVILELPNTEVALVRPVNLARPQSNDLPHRVNVLDNIVLDDIL